MAIVDDVKNARDNNLWRKRRMSTRRTMYSAAIIKQKWYNVDEDDGRRVYTKLGFYIVTSKL